MSVGLVGLLASSTNKTLWDLDFTLAILSGCTREFAHRFQGGDFHTQYLCMVWFAVNLLEDLSLKKTELLDFILSNLLRILIS